MTNEAIYWKTDNDEYEVRVFNCTEKPGYTSRNLALSGTMNFEMLERLMASYPEETVWAHSPPVGHLALSEPEFVGKMPLRQELPASPWLWLKEDPER